MKLTNRSSFSHDFVHAMARWCRAKLSVGPTDVHLTLTDQPIDQLVEYVGRSLVGLQPNDDADGRLRKFLDTFGQHRNHLISQWSYAKLNSPNGDAESRRVGADADATPRPLEETDMSAKKTAKKTSTNAAKPEAKVQAMPEQPDANIAVVAKTKAAKTKPAGEKKLSALDAAAKVLGETGQPMSSQEMIAAMAAKGYWTSPGGKTPHATLYAAILREVNIKGKDARFKKTERGKFALA
jgi:hypothetical protein